MYLSRRSYPLLYLTATLFPINSFAGSARDYLNAPVDSWLGFYNAGYSSSVTPEDGMDITSDVRANVLSQSFMLTRTMDYWGRTGGFHWFSLTVMLKPILMTSGLLLVAYLISACCGKLICLAGRH